jgi:hypothetical protein
MIYFQDSEELEDNIEILVANIWKGNKMETTSKSWFSSKQAIPTEGCIWVLSSLTLALKFGLLCDHGVLTS